MKAAVRTQYGSPEVLKVQEVEKPNPKDKQERFRPVVDRKYPLEKIAEAYNQVASGQKTGNVVITLADNS